MRSGSANTTSKPMATRAELGEAGDEVGDHGARPRPLPDLLEARLVDIDDDDRPRGLLARPQHLKQIEGAQPQFLERPRIGKAQRHQREQQHQAHRPRHAECRAQRRNAFHDPANLPHAATVLSRGGVLTSSARCAEERVYYFSRNERMSWSCSGLIR